MTAYTIAARANAALLAAEAGALTCAKPTDTLFDCLGRGAGSAGRVTDEAARSVEYAYETRGDRGIFS